MTCLYCGEPMTLAEIAATQFNALHSECGIRAVIGSAAHQLGECSCYGGTREDPPGLTPREGAKLAYDAFMLLRKARSGVVH